jgi:hypothetical protein
MKSLVIAALAIVLLGSYSFVYACRGSKAARTAKAPASPTAVASFVSLPAPTEAVVVCKTVRAVAPLTVCKTVESLAPLTVDVDVDVPVESLGSMHAIHIRGTAIERSTESTGPVSTVVRTAKVAATLGRAFVTTIGAVFGSIVDAALNARAALV